MTRTVKRTNAVDRQFAAKPAKRTPPINALKHGAYSALDVLPTEDWEEFVRLHDALTEEWQPCGPTEEDAVHSLAKHTFRKRNLHIFRTAAKARALFGPVTSATVQQEQQDDYNAKSLELLAKIFVIEEIAEDDDQAREVLAKIKQDGKSGVAIFCRAIELSQLFNLGELPTPEGYGRLLDLEARLDAMIDRALKRLIYLKAVKPSLKLAASR